MINFVISGYTNIINTSLPCRTAIRMDIEAIIKVHIDLSREFQLDRNNNKLIIFREFQLGSDLGFQFKDWRIKRNITERLTIEFMTNYQVFSKKLTSKH